MLLSPGWKGDVYEGQYVCGVKCGKGRSTTTNGSEYIGRFSNDKRHGHGIFRLNNGAVYEGEYKNNKQDGYGFMKYWCVINARFFISYKDALLYGYLLFVITALETHMKVGTEMARRTARGSISISRMEK